MSEISITHKKNRGTASYERSLACRFPSLAKEWNYKRNTGEEKPENVYPYSAKKVWWAKDSREFMQKLKDRTCNIRKVPLKPIEISGARKGKKKVGELLAVSNLAIMNPEVAAEWDYDKNGGLRPEDFLDRSGKKVWWKCSEGHSWQAAIHNRTVKLSRCPVCVRNSKKLIYKNPKLFTELSLEKNTEIDLFSLSASSSQKVWWKCPDCGELYYTSVHSRNKGNSCEKCHPKEPRKVKYEKSLAYRFPELSMEWHPTLNGDLKPEDVTAMSGLSVWWRCSENPDHKPWKSVIHNRSSRGNGCPSCRYDKGYNGYMKKTA